ncbi:hypothetical protein Tco_0154446 [Tanacetum coccineum]
MALGVKLKLGLKDGSCLKPTNDSEEQERGIRCDYMHVSYGRRLVKGMAKVMVSLEFIKFSKELKRIKTFLLRRERLSLIASFFNKLKKCWDELHNLNGMPTCNCGKMKEYTCSVIEKFALRDSNSELIKFLMKLNAEYELGYPDWYKGKKAKKNNRLAAQVNSWFDEHFSRDTPFDIRYENEVGMS